MAAINVTNKYFFIRFRAYLPRTSPKYRPPNIPMTMLNTIPERDIKVFIKPRLMLRFISTATIAENNRNTESDKSKWTIQILLLRNIFCGRNIPPQSIFIPNIFIYSIQYYTTFVNRNIYICIFSPKKAHFLLKIIKKREKNNFVKKSLRDINFIIFKKFVKPKMHLLFSNSWFNSSSKPSV